MIIDDEATTYQTKFEKLHISGSSPVSSPTKPLSKSIGSTIGPGSPTLRSTDNKFLFSSAIRSHRVANLSPSSHAILKDVFLKTTPSSTSSQHMINSIRDPASSTATMVTPPSYPSPYSSQKLHAKTTMIYSQDHVANIEKYVNILLYEHNLRSANTRREAMEAIYRALPYLKYNQALISELIESLATNLEMYPQQEGNR
jgi:hypothetical protein